ncbi:MAG: hypothetical protein GY943_25330 [Chloroflexi bacterium]|nr:hypothetical protein [Chloroflexota bacterium]
MKKDKQGKLVDKRQANQKSTGNLLLCSSLEALQHYRQHKKERSYSTSKESSLRAPRLLKCDPLSRFDWH